MEFSKELTDKILKGADYLSKGIPLKDAMDKGDVDEVIIQLAWWLKENEK